jgi:hypothetical protein
VRTSRTALRLAQTPAYEVVYAADGLPAGIVWPDDRWECSDCLVGGSDGRFGLLFHVGARHGGAA